jgi:hypothetical protein
MIRLRGKPFGPGFALGSASVLRASEGIPMLPAGMVAKLARSPRNVPIDPMEVILVAEDYAAAASLSLPWARVVGIVAARVDAWVQPSGITAVVGIENLMESVPEGALLLIDGDRGVVLVDPDGTALAAYQAERERIAPRRRIYLDYAHQPARSWDGREIHVLAQVRQPEEVEMAIGNGADGLYIPANTPLLPPAASDEEQYECLQLLADATVGKPVSLRGDAQTLSSSALLRVANRIELTLVATLSKGAANFTDLRDHIQETRIALLEEVIGFNDIRLAGATALGEKVPDSLTEYPIERVVVEMNEPGALARSEAQNWLDNVTTEAAGMLLPVELLLPDASGPNLETALGLGVVGLIVHPQEVQVTKERVRSLDVSACREALYAR